MRDIYPIFFKYHHILPDEVGKQNPWALFSLLDSLEEENNDYSDNEHLMMFYGR